MESGHTLSVGKNVHNVNVESGAWYGNSDDGLLFTFILCSCFLFLVTLIVTNQYHWVHALLLLHSNVFCSHLVISSSLLLLQCETLLGLNKYLHWFH